MGTRSLTHIKDDDGTTLVTIYRQFDGYLEGHGHELATILSGAKLVNGISGPEPVFNGMGCLAAQVITRLKLQAHTSETSIAGNIYVYPPDSKGVGEEFVYTITKTKTGTIHITCFEADWDSGKTKARPIFSGSPQALLKKLEPATVK